LLLGQSAFDYADPVLHEGNALLQVGLAFLYVQQSRLECLGLPDPLLQVGLRAPEGRQPAGGRAQGQREHQKASDNNPQNDPSDHEPHTTPGTQKQRAPHRLSRGGLARAAGIVFSRGGLARAAVMWVVPPGSAF
jgi:hypothetical protein